MPGTQTYLWVAPKTVLPVRIHVNRKRLLLSKLFESAVGQSAHQRAILTLRQTNYIRVSNIDIQSLIDAVGDELGALLLHTPLTALLQRQVPNEIPTLPHTFCIDLKKSAWKCHMVVPIVYVANLRQRLMIALSPEDVALAQRAQKSAPNVKMLAARLLVRDTVVKPAVLMEEDDAAFTVRELDAAADSKKTNVSYRLHRPHVLTDLNGRLDLYIYERPHKK